MLLIPIFEESSFEPFKSYNAIGYSIVYTTYIIQFEMPLA